MRHNLLHLNNRNHDIIVFNASSSDKYSSNTSEIIKMKEIVSKAVMCELTDRQRECVMMYFYDKKPMKEIAKELSICKSTVSRHIKAALNNLQSVAKYY